MSCSVVDLGDFTMTSKDATLTLTTSASLSIKNPHRDSEGVPMSSENWTGESCVFTQSLAHMIEELDIWTKLGLRLRQADDPYAHSPGSFSLNYMVEHVRLEPACLLPISGVIAELECVRCELNFNTDPSTSTPPLDVGQVGSGDHADEPPTIRKAKRRRTGKKDASRCAESDPGGNAAEAPRDSPVSLQLAHTPGDDAGVLSVSNHPELEDVVSTSIHHLLQGSRPRGSRISRRPCCASLTELAPAIFDMPRMKAVSRRSQWLHVPLGILTHFAEAESRSLRRKMHDLCRASGSEPGDNGDDNPPRLIGETALRRLVHSGVRGLPAQRPKTTKESDAGGSFHLVVEGLPTPLPSSQGWNRDDLGPEKDALPGFHQTRSVPECVSGGAEHHVLRSAPGLSLLEGQGLPGSGGTMELTLDSVAAYPSYQRQNLPHIHGQYLSPRGFEEEPGMHGYYLPPIPPHHATAFEEGGVRIQDYTPNYPDHAARLEDEYYDFAEDPYPEEYLFGGHC